MRKNKQILLVLLISGSIGMFSCNDKSSDDNPKEISKNCKITKMDENGEFITYYKWEGDNLKQDIVINKSGDTNDITNYEYQDGKLKYIEDTYNHKWEIFYSSNGLVERVDNYDGELIESISNIKYNEDGNPISIDVFDQGNPDYLSESYVYTWNGNNLKTSLAKAYNEDGTLDDTEEIIFTSFDNNKNYLKDIPFWLISPDYALGYSANNVKTATIKNAKETTNLTINNTYDNDNKLIQFSYSFDNYSLTTNLTYECD